MMPIMSYLTRALLYTQVLARHGGAKTLLDLVDLGVDDEVCMGK